MIYIEYILDCQHPVYLFLLLYEKGCSNETKDKCN